MLEVEKKKKKLLKKVGKYVCMLIVSLVLNWNWANVANKPTKNYILAFKDIGKLS